MNQTIEREQQAFDFALPDLLEEHEGEWVVFRDAKPVLFEATLQKAYAAAVERYGSREVFLVQEVRPARSEPVSISWEAGVMYSN